MRGLINIQVSDLNTGKPIESKEQENIITNNFLRAIFENRTLSNLSIYTSNAVYKPSLYPTRNIADNATLGFSKTTSSTLIPGVSRVQFIDKTASNAAYIQVSTRILPPATGQTRTIKSVVLTTDPNVNYDILAYSELATPCVQTDSQVYDIYYRIMFEYVETEGSLSEELYLNTVKDLALYGDVDLANGHQVRWLKSIFPKLKQKPGDNFLEIGAFNWSTPSYGTYFDNHYSIATAKAGHYKVAVLDPVNGFDFNNQVGMIVCSVKNMPYTAGPLFLARGTSYSNVFVNNSKIQNLFGFKLDSTNVLSIPFLDIDNLAQGSGAITLGGAWQNNKTPQNAGMYAKTLMPKRGIITITNSGGIGSATYKYTERTFLGSFKSPNNYYNWNPIIEIQPITSYTGTDLRGASNKGLLGNVSDGSIDTQQLSATVSYDGTSVLIPKKNKILLYSIAGSEYWFITGAFTNIHQLAVVNGVVYIACKETGLYKVDPRVSLLATQVAVVGNLSPDFTSCYGVSEGYNGSLWAVGKNAIAKYDGATWTVYDSTTTPAFGSNNDHYTRIEYLKVDKTSVNNQMLLVYKPEYTSTKLGLWWSTITNLTETGDHPNISNIGRPKFNRRDVGGIDGFWSVIAGDASIYVCAFNGGSFVYKTTIRPVRDSSINYVNKDGVNYLYAPKDNISYPGGYGSSSTYGLRDNFFLPDGTLSHAVTDNSKTSVLLIYTSQNYSRETRDVKSTPTVNGYAGYYDCRCNIILDDGIMFSISKYSHRSGEEISAHIYQIGLENTMHGGAFREITRKNYGWNGTAWELNHPGSKTIHSASETLLDGVTVSFANGSTGTSFVAGNLYTFGLCEGLLKDNATKAKLNLPVFFSKTKTGVAELTSATVPASTNLGTGVVGIHPTWKSKDAFADPANSNRITFPGNTPGEFAIGNIELSGDFEFRIPCTHLNNALTNRNTVVGIGDPHFSGNPSIELYFYETTLRVYYFTNAHTLTGAASLTEIGGLLTTDIVGLKRVGEVFSVTKNGVVVATLNNGNIPLLFAKKKRYHIMFAKNYSTAQTYSPSNCFCPLVTVVSNGSDNVVKIGNEVNGTEYFDLNCKGVTEYAPIVAKLNGVPAVVRTDNSAVVAGEVGIDLEGLYLYFNPADFGKTIELECTRYWNK